LEDIGKNACVGLSEGSSGGADEGPSASFNGGPSKDRCGGLSAGESGDPNDEPSLNPNDNNEFIKEMFLNISNIMVSQNIPRERYVSLTTKKCNVLKKAQEMFMAAF